MTDITAKSESVIATSDKKGSSKTCRYFKKGFCGYGEKCSFSHCEPKIRPRLGSSNPSDVENCRFFKKASCKFASKCWYNHLRPNGKPYPKPDPLNKFIVVGPSSDKLEEIEEAPPSAVIPAQETEVRRSFKRPQNLDIISKNCFYYEKKGACQYGDKCWYSHSESRVQVNLADESLYELDPELELDPDHTKMCYNFTFDICEFGDECAYVHGDICQFCDLALLHPFDEQQRKDHLEACEIFFLEDMDISFAFMRSKVKTCTICLDSVWGLNKLYTKWKFGIQDACNHVFCLDCIRHWRYLKRSKGQPRLCPACRAESSVVVPSTYWFKSENEKEQWVEAYKTAVKDKPCKFYQKGKCLNKEKCHYSHSGFTPPVVVREGDEIWANSVQEGPGNLTEGTEDITDDRDQQDSRGQNVQDPNTWGDMSPDDQTNEDLALQSGEQVSTSNLAEEHQRDASGGQVNIVDDGDERNVEKQVGQDPGIWEDTPPEDQSNQDSVWQSAEQRSASDLVEEMVEHHFDDNLGQVEIVDDQRDVERQVVEQDPGSSFDHKRDASVRQVNIVDDGDERNIEKQVGQDSDIWEDTPPEDQSNQDSVLQSAEQRSASNLVEEIVEHQFDDNLGHVEIVDDQRDVESQVVEQDPGSSFDSSSQDQTHNLPLSSDE